MFVLACALLLAPAASSTAAARDLTAITRVLQDSAAAWSRGDLDGFMASYERSPRTAFVTPTGVVGAGRPCATATAATTAARRDSAP